MAAWYDLHARAASSSHTEKDRQMPFVNIKTPEGALSRAQKEEIVHRTTDMLVEYFSEAARAHTMVLIEEVKDGGYARADEVFVLPARHRAKDDD
jgi:4-oxalocrotonate tautomerase